ncbi:MAG: hypothetical protein B6D61_09105 [Bacteroidetes bacterium 4484_249]|nr:MAG: hypothetical protein B6D61_09105 [Bacteroidetes bacterium 4484_249]
MKNNIVFLTALSTTLCLILFANGLMYAQKYTYKPLALEGAHWLVGFTDNNMPPWAYYDIYQYVIRGDTVLGDIVYKKVYFRSLTDSVFHYIENEKLAGLVRDDTVNKKVYAINIDFDNLWECPEYEESLLYDFNKTIGDTLELCIVLWGPCTIFDIGYDYRYGEDRKILNTSNCEFTEGIGSDFGVFEWGYGSKESGFNDRGWGFSLFDYCLGTDEECGCQWVDIEKRELLPKLRVYPNPLTGNTITLASNIPITQPLDVKLYDITGREVYQQHFENLAHEVTIQIPTPLLSGTSPLLLWAGNSRQVFFKQLIVKQ